MRRWPRNAVPWRRLALASFCNAGRACRFSPVHRGWCRDHAIAYSLVKFAAWLRSLS